MGGVGSGRSGRSGEWVPTPHSLGGETAVVSFSLESLEMSILVIIQGRSISKKYIPMTVLR